jgi:hypothetical protein
MKVKIWREKVGTNNSTYAPSKTGTTMVSKKGSRRCCGDASRPQKRKKDDENKCLDEIDFLSAYLQINRTKINVPNINVLQINGSLHQQKLVEV